jgi:hypothetical protein
MAAAQGAGWFFPARISHGGAADDSQAVHCGELP